MMEYKICLRAHIYKIYEQGWNLGNSLSKGFVSLYDGLSYIDSSIWKPISFSTIAVRQI